MLQKFHLAMKVSHYNHFQCYILNNVMVELIFTKLVYLLIHMWGFYIFFTLSICSFILLLTVLHTHTFYVHLSY